ncbi:MAG: hypothetical protein JEZ09_16310 [Salinivirgaceae bacterium]|nr:hypothetical protein [Salinivirgaceae bacterium]
MKTLVFCNNIQSAQIIFELIRRRLFSGLVVPSSNKELIQEIADSGYLEPGKLFTPNLKDDNELIDILQKVQADVCLVITFPKIFSQEILDIPRLGFYNFHYGLLPKYRSADPIFWQIKNQEKLAGVTVLKMNGSIDGGPILLEDKFPIEPYDTYAMLLHKSVVASCQILNQLVDLLLSEKIKTKQQELKGSKYLPKPTLKDVTIDWKNMTMSEIVATVNAGNPWNRGAIAEYEGEKIRIVQVSPAKYNKDLPDDPGKIILANQQYGVFVVCKNRELIRIETIHSALGYHSGGMILTTGITEGNFIT